MEFCYELRINLYFCRLNEFEIMLSKVILQSKIDKVAKYFDLADKIVFKPDDSFDFDANNISHDNLFLIS